VTGTEPTMTIRRETKRRLAHHRCGESRQSAPGRRRPCVAMSYDDYGVQIMTPARKGDPRTPTVVPGRWWSPTIPPRPTPQPQHGGL